MQKSIKRSYKLRKNLRWLARLSSILTIAVLLMFLIGEGFDISKVSSNQWIGFLFFPCGVVLGFIIAWKEELLGGIISVLSLIGFYLIYGQLINGKYPQGLAFLIFTLPALVFVISGVYAYFAIGKLDKKVSNHAIRN